MNKEEQNDEIERRKYETMTTTLKEEKGENE